VRYRADPAFDPVGFAQSGAVFPDRARDIYQIVLIRGFGPDDYRDNDPLLRALRAAGVEEVID
jgi:hypothetical protein